MKDIEKKKILKEDIEIKDIERSMNGLFYV